MQSLPIRSIDVLAINGYVKYGWGGAPRFAIKIAQKIPKHKKKCFFMIDNVI